MSDVMIDDDTDVAVIERVRMDPPRLWNVILLNDEKTTMEFVVLILMQIFHKTFEDAQDIMMSIHDNGRGIAGTYSHEVSATKRDETMTIARTNDCPLVAIIEPKE